MAKKKTSKKSSNSYWMKYGGNHRKMHKGGFTHPHPHPKNATDSELKGAQLWATSTYDGKPLKKHLNYEWGDDESNINAFRSSNWFKYFPDTLKDVPTTYQDLKDYEKAIDANESRTIELYDTKFDDFGDLMYGTSTAIRGLAMSTPKFTPQTAVGSGLLWLSSLIPTGIKAGWDYHKRKTNTKLKENNPNAVFINRETGEIMNYEDNEHSLFNSFLYPRGVTEVRVKPSAAAGTGAQIGDTYYHTTGGPDDLKKVVEDHVVEDDPMLSTDKDKYKVDSNKMKFHFHDADKKSMGGQGISPGQAMNAVKSLIQIAQPDPKYMGPVTTDASGNIIRQPSYVPDYFGVSKKREMGGVGHNPVKDVVEDPTFKMWFAKNARRPDVIQSSGSTEQLKSLFLKDINFPGNAMPLFSGEIDHTGNIDKSGRPIDISTRMVGGLKYGGMPKAELGMGQGLYESPTDYIRDYTNKEDRKRNWQQDIGKVGDSNFLQLFNFALPGAGLVLDLAADIFGFAGDKKQYKDLQQDASKSRNILRHLSREGVNKETLDLSTRMDAVTAKSSHGMAKPNFWTDLAPEIVGNVGSFAASGMIGDALGIGGGGMGGGEIGDFVDPAGLNPGDALAKYGLPRYHNGGELDQYAMGGANLFQPGLTNSMIAGMANPLSAQEQFKSTGMQQEYNTGGQGQSQEYEAEGGEVIMHGPGEVPVTTGETEQLDGEMNEAMLSLLHGNSHETQDPNGHTGEIVQGDQNQYVFSKSLKSKVWNTNFAEAAEKIGANIARFKKEAESGDSITKSTSMSMIDAWNQKLIDLQKEQEQAREVKFSEMLNSGASPEELQQAFPDIYEKFMAQQQEEQLSQAAISDLTAQAQMAANPMGDIDTSQLSPEEQQLVGAKYGLPQMNNGGFEPYDFNRYFGELQGEGLFEGVDQGNFTLGKDYFPKRGELMDFLTMNYPDEGYTFGDQTYTSAKDMYKALQSDFSTRRGSWLESIGSSLTRPDKDDYMIDIEQLNPATNEMETSWDWKPAEGDYAGGKQEFTQDKAAWQLYNRGLPIGWDENFGRDVNMSKRKYFRNLETQLLADGKSPQEVRSIIDREKLKYEETSNLESKESAPELSAEEKAAALAEKAKKAKRVSDFISKGADLFKTLGPTMYNFLKGREPAEQEAFVSNKNENQIKQNLNRLTNLDISPLLGENEQNFNMLKYLARDASGGNLGHYLNTLTRGQNIQNVSDAKAFAHKTKSDITGLKIANESLYNLGEKDRAEGIRVSEVNAMNRAAKEAFTAKGWEGLSGHTQMQDLMKNQMGQDKQLTQLLGQIYPDAHLYMNRSGEFDWDKFLQSGDLDKLMKEHPELKDKILKYFDN